ncbi:unnamed protein product, partial [Phaeothamnion confervicola]
DWKCLSRQTRSVCVFCPASESFLIFLLPSRLRFGRANLSSLSFDTKEFPSVLFARHSAVLLATSPQTISTLCNLTAAHPLRMAQNLRRTSRMHSSVRPPVEGKKENWLNHNFNPSCPLPLSTPLSLPAPPPSIILQHFRSALPP